MNHQKSPTSKILQIYVAKIPKSSQHTIKLMLQCTDFAASVTALRQSALTQWPQLQACYHLRYVLANRRSEFQSHFMNIRFGQNQLSTN